MRETQIYRDYHKAFTHSTGLPLRLRDATQVGVALKFGKGSSSFCSLMAETDVSCHACLAMQKQISQRAQIQSKSLKCFAGLCETAVPVRVGENLVAWLETGQVLIDSPTKSKFSRLAKTLLRWGTHVDLKRAEEAYFNTRVPEKRGVFPPRCVEPTPFLWHLASSRSGIMPDLLTNKLEKIK